MVADPDLQGQILQEEKRSRDGTAITENLRENDMDKLASIGALLYTKNRLNLNASGLCDVTLQHSPVKGEATRHLRIHTSIPVVIVAL